MNLVATIKYSWWLVLPFIILILFTPSQLEAGAEVYRTADFDIEYPDDWTAEEDQNALLLIWSKQNDSRITVTVHDEYRLVSPYEDEFISIKEMNRDILDVITESMQKTCRYNIEGLCWNYKELESKIITISHHRAALVTYMATINDHSTITSTIIIPDGQRIWILKGTSLKDGPSADDMSGIMGTFQIHAAGQHPLSSNLAPQTRSDIVRSPTSTLEKIIDINLIMIGSSWSASDVATISESLPEYEDPIYIMTGEKIGIRYHYNYKFISKPDAAEEIVKVMTENSKVTELFGSNVRNFDVWQIWWIQQHPELSESEYRLVDAEVIESHLHEAVIQADPELTRPSSANLIFLDIDPDVGHIRNYYTSGLDKATNHRTDFVGLMGYGGNHNLFFFDMWAVPWVDYDTKSGSHVVRGYMKNLHDCKGSCVSEIVAEHAESAVRHIVTPPLLYPVEHYDEYNLDVLVYLKPGGHVTVTPATLSRFINQEEILKEMQYLYPFAEWEMQTSIERRDLRGLSYDFKRQFEQVRHLTATDMFGNEYSYALLSTERLTPYLVEWGETRLQDKTSTDTWNIPILIVLDSSTTEVLLDDGAIGMAAGIPGNKSLPCCALGVSDEGDVWDDGVGLSNLILHEAGHLLGLSHPFYTVKDNKFVENWYFNWYASPMTYSMPTHPLACGIFYNSIYDEPCGNYAMSFTAFERERIADARLVSVLKKTIGNIQILEDDKQVASVSQKMTDAILSFESGHTSSADDVLSVAIDAYRLSVDYATVQDDNIIDDDTETVMTTHDNSTTETRSSWVQAAPEGDVLNGFDSNEVDTVAVPRLESMSISDIFVADKAGNWIGTVRTGQQVQITATISNMQQDSQQFVHIIQIQDSEGFVVSVVYEMHTLDAGLTFVSKLPWIPSSSGTYKVTLFAWSSQDTPVPLSHPETILITVR